MRLISCNLSLKKLFAYKMILKNLFFRYKNLNMHSNKIHINTAYILKLQLDFTFSNGSTIIRHSTEHWE